MSSPVELAPSMLCADFARLEKVTRKLEKAGVDRLHLDVMDGHFVPNLTYGPVMWEALRKVTDLPFDAHLMVANPDDSIDWYLETGAEWVSVHVEAARHLHRTVQRLREKGSQPGVALNPATPIAALDDILDDLAYVTIMSVNPGFARQKYIGTMTDKVARLRAVVDDRKPDVKIVVDGGMSPKTAPDVVAAGADVVVSGGGLFQEGVPFSETVAAMREAIAKGLERRPPKS